MHGLERAYRGDLYVHYINVDDYGSRQLVSEYNATAIPLIVIMNDKGEVSATFRGLTDEATLRQAINKALSESAADNKSPAKT